MLFKRPWRRYRRRKCENSKIKSFEQIQTGIINEKAIKNGACKIKKKIRNWWLIADSWAEFFWRRRPRKKLWKQKVKLIIWFEYG